MSRIKLLLDVIEDVRSLGDSLQALADAMASGRKNRRRKPGRKQSLSRRRRSLLLQKRSRKRNR